MQALENVCVEQDAIKREAGMLRQLVEKNGGGGSSRDTWERQQEEEREVDKGDDARSIVLHELERVHEEDHDQIVGQEWQEE